MRVHKARHTYRPGEPVLPWIFAITRHTRPDSYRKTRRVEVRETPVAVLPELAAAPVISHDTSAVDAMFGVLPESRREVLVLLKVCGMTIEEVARATSSSVGSVKQKAHRAYATLRNALIGGARGTPDLTVAYSAERARIPNNRCECFWLEGASAETGFTVYKGLAAAVEITGGHVSNIGSGVNLGKFALMAGPRYTLGVSRWTSRLTRTNQTAVFGEALFGVAHAFDSTLPSSLGSGTDSTSSSIQLGGGLDLSLRSGLALRTPEVDYVRTAFPNNGSHTQNDLKLSLGVSWRFPSAAHPH